MKRENNKPKIINRLISAAVSVALMVTGVPFPEFSGGFHFQKKEVLTVSPVIAEDTIPAGITENLFDPSTEIGITTPEQLKNFAWWYNTYAPNTAINVSIGITDTVTYNGVSYINLRDGFTSIGTDEKPFYGTIKFTSGSADTFSLRVPLFGTIHQGTAIVDENNNSREIQFLCSEAYTGDTLNLPVTNILASKVVNPNSSATLPLELKATLLYTLNVGDDSIATRNISGMIGTIEENASVKFTLTNDAFGQTDYSRFVNVTGSGSIGLLCGEMKENSSLEANILSGTNNNYSVTSSDGAAGGLVGKMNTGSKLIMPTADGANAGFNGLTQTINGTYAGGLVGYAENAYVGTTAPAAMYPISMTVGSSVKTTSTTLNGSSGNGQLFGYYKISDVTIPAVMEGETVVTPKAVSKNCTITLDSLSNMPVKAIKGNAGGLIGVLEFASTAEASAADSPVFTINGGAGVTDASATGTKNLTLNFSGSNNGGLIGVYKTADLKNTLEITNVYTSLSGTSNATVGGLIGKIDDTDSAAYVKIEKAHTEGNKGGGFIGTAGSTDTKGAFIDILDYNKVNGGSTGGLVCSQPYGVLRLAGVTDLTSLSSGSIILNSRDTTLVYSNGDGNDSTWTLKRPNISSDDIGTWGEVFRLTGIIDETTFSSAHTVSIPAAPVSTENTNITTLADFAKLALNIQHNTTNSGSPLITDTTNTSKSSNILNSDIYLNGTFDLSGTGITGLTRDGGSSEQVFTGNLTGGTINLAVGEHYGNNELTEGNGRIYSHRWSGLFSAIQGATISNVTITGTCDKKPNGSDDNYFGGLAAVYEGSDATNLTNVSSSVSCNIKSGSKVGIIGGIIGGVYSTTTGELSFNGCSSTATMTDGTGQDNYFGGYIAYVNRSSDAITINFGNTSQCTIGGSYTNSSAKARPIYGGLIGAVRGTDAHSIATTINIDDVAVSSLSVTASLNGSSPNGAGGLLGYAWYDAEVNIPKLSVTGSSVTATGGAGNLGGLVYAATGHWTVCGSGTNDTVTFASSTLTGAGSLGLLVTRAFNEVSLGSDSTTDSEAHTADKNSALYLELKNQAKYDSSGVTVSGATVFDELVAYSKHPDKDITENDGHAIVSINTDGAGTGVIMSGSACNTYQNKNSYSIKKNSNTRYYYNLDTIRAKASKTDAENFLLWSVNRYAHSSIRSNFPYTTPTGTGTFSLDMNGLSYYTIDYDSTFPYSGKNFSIKFYNKEIEDGEAGTGNSDGTVRSTVDSDYQHYMMHCGMFRNAGASTVSVGSITVSGNVGKYNSGSGFIISGQLGGDAGINSKFSASSITLNGAYVNDGSSGYAPMIINKIRKNTSLDIKNVRSSNYLDKTVATVIDPETGNSVANSWYAASSLIGEVGDSGESDSNMNLEFSSIALDARKTADAISTDFNSVYGSHRSIFSHSSLLEHYIYSGTDSKGVYNYRWEEDWTNIENASNPHLVTYGAEIDNTVDNIDENSISEQLYYFGYFENLFTHPTNKNATFNKDGADNAAKYANKYGAFATNFYPYVYNIGSTKGDNIHELRVNMPVADLTQGCGTYNDPYVISDGKQLYAAASLIANKNFTDTTFKINLPIDSITGNLQWCDPATDDDTSEHKTFQLNTASTPQFANGSKTWDRNAVRKYLAGAYYLIDGNITLPSDFSGLGAGTDETTNYDYAFRGVIVGKDISTTETPVYPTITLTNGVPFVENSNGCVIKNLEFTKGAFTFGTQTEKAEFLYNGGCKAYGGIINKIMGGDNIIDHVGVTMNAPTNATSTYEHTIPVGGYVGVVFNGGLFFRNMDTVTNKTGIAAYKTDANKKYLYRNPIIGRVLNGYAVCEDCDSLDNGDKNYYISHLDSTDTNKLTITSNSITANDAQSWFVLSLLVNSGTMSDKSPYINEKSKTRHLGSYDDVGCLNTKTSSTICDADKVIFTAGAETGNVVPYLMYKYTTNQATWLNTSTGYAITMGGGTWNLPKGYRGIGGFNGFDTGSAIDGSVSKNCNNTCNIKVSGITGNSTTINLDMKHLGYRHEVKKENGSYAVTQDNYSTTENGFGLFNLFSPSKDGVTVENITLSGTVYSDYVDKDTGEVFHAYPDSKNNWNAYYAWTITNSRRLSTGMFAGAKPDSSKTLKVTLSNVSLNNASVHSGKHSGGFIGNASNVTLSACPATNVSSFGRSSVGGLIGYASDSSKVSGATGGTAVTINAVTEQAKGYSNTTGKEGRYSGVGGLVGMSTAITIENINLSSVAGGLVQYDNLGSDDSSYVGGILGMSRGAITIQNCSVNQVSALGTANRVGGLAGGTLGNQTLTATNVTIDGRGTATLTCTGKESVGGVIGYASAKVSLTDVIIKNYTMQKYDINESSANAMGGVVGSLYSDLDMKNVLITNCTLEKIGASGSNLNLVAGGIIGRVSTVTIQGYNVVLRDISVNNTLDSDGKYKGNFIGSGTPTNYKIVGLSLQGSLPTNKLINDTITNPTAASSNNKYIIFSNYKGTNLPTASTAGTGSAPKFNDVAVSMVDVKSPYATVNPRVTIDSADTPANELTGDGMAVNANSLPIKTILTDMQKTGTEKPNYAYTVSPLQTNFTNALSDFNAEFTDANLTNNFAVLLLESLNHDTSDNLINSYLQLITNTNYDFGSDLNSVYKVDIYRMEYNKTTKKFEKNTTDVHLKRDTTNKQFYMAGGDDVDTVDTTKPTFSLIDITFFDPTSTSKAAYHVYVPVLTKKMLKYKFELATGSGTPYEPSWYQTNNRFTSGILAENIGSPGTLYFKYTYQRTKKEWQDALNYGENFLSNYNKSLEMTPVTNNTVIKELPAETKLILVDANRKGKAYYSTMGTAYSNHTLNLSQFTNFEPIQINDLIYITAAQSGSGEYLEYNEERDGTDKPATVEAYLNGTKTKFRLANNDSGTKYHLTVVDSMENKDAATHPTSDDTTIELEERYYLSIFTNKENYRTASTSNETGESTEPENIDTRLLYDEAIHYFTVGSGRLVPTNGLSPTKYVESQMKQVLFANLFNQNNVTYQTLKVNSTSSINPEEINSVNNSVKVSLNADISLTNNANSLLGTQLTTISIYQSFLVYLTKNDSNEHTRAIQGSPTAAANITISSSNESITPQTFQANATNSYASVGMDYVEVASNAPLGTYINNGNTATIQADVLVQYELPAQQKAQFPSHTGNPSDDQNKYAEVSAYSNLGFEPGKTALSKNQKLAELAGNGNNYHYYIVSQEDPLLNYYAYASDGSQFGQLGINANDLPDNTGKVHITTAADFDIRPIASQVAEANYVKFTLTLQQKKQKDTFNYSEYQVVDNIKKYLYNVQMNLEGVEKTETVENGNTISYTFIVPRANVIALDENTSATSNYMKLPISFDVYTGSDASVDESGNTLNSFESRGLMYANYKIAVSAEMLIRTTTNETSSDSIVGKNATGELVYTNAKLLGDYIK